IGGFPALFEGGFGVEGQGEENAVGPGLFVFPESEDGTPSEQGEDEGDNDDPPLHVPGVSVISPRPSRKFMEYPATTATLDTLPNGLTVILDPDPSAPVVSAQVWVETGSLHEGGRLGSGL